MFRIEEHELLGEGAFGQVFRATIRNLNNAKKQTVAIKKVKGNKRRFFGLQYIGHGELVILVKTGIAILHSNLL